MKYLTLVFLFFLITLSSCALVKLYIIKHKDFISCNLGDIIGLEKRIKLNGYYMSKYKNNLNTILLYNDGSFAHLWVNYETQENLENYFKSTDEKYFRGAYLLMWGGVTISKDTIKAQYFYKKEAWYLEVNEMWFTILNDSTLSFIESICKPCKREGVWKNDGIAIINPPKIFHFVPFSHKPDSLCWLKKKSWYYCK